MATKRTKKRKPYDPFNPYGNHSLAWYQQEASRRAGQDVQNQVNALPSAGFYTSSSQQLADALGKIQKNQAGLAAQSGGLYNQAYQKAAEPANRATMAAGGQVQNQAPGAGDLLTALGTGSALAMGGLQTAATARGNQLVQDRAKQESTIRGGLQASTDKYLQQMRDDALQAAVQRFNNQLAGQQFGLQASNTAFDNNLNAAQLNERITNDSANRSAKSSAAKSKKRQAKLKEVRGLYDKWTKQSSQPTGNTVYTFNVPKVGEFPITAKDGPTALNLAMQKLTAMGVTGVTGTQVGGFLKSQKPETSMRSAKSQRDAYKRARDILVQSGLFTSKEAIKFMRQYVGANSNGPLVL